MKFLRTGSQHPDFILLIQQLDAYLAIQDGDEHAFYHQFNSTENLKNVVIAYDGEVAIGCGAIKEFQSGIVEIKRMYVDPSYRGRGVASAVLSTLEGWARELGFHKSVLETGKRQPEAVALYKKCSYQIIPNYGQYVGMENSVCFEKILTN